ncbi:IscS subfamily cysteine desulfurase [Neobacillus sp. D3-1R]|uniref:IscS subfamily cysteine desulfurase n=1 Tax=Neobacillus sp. D3-1R TaxID=3445778 RepID=UPI003F9FBE15
MIYLDYAATCPLDKDAADAYIQVSTQFFGNTSSLHDIGGGAAQLLENCRETIAHLVDLDKRGFYFTSGGSESNVLAIEALLTATKKKGKHIITSIAEHSSIHSALKRLEKDGYEITYLPYLSSGIIDLDTLLKEIRSDTVLITIQHTNSEIGTIQPLEEISTICSKRDIYFHSDFVQAFGKSDIRKIARLVDSFSFSSHKFYGPKGVGGVYINPTIHWTSFFPGTSHEKGLRPGTVNLPGIASMTVAAEKAIHHLEERNRHFSNLREVFIHGLEPIQKKVTIYGTDKNGNQYPGIIGLSIDGIEGQWLMLECNRLGFAISTGSACQAGMQSPSKTISALGITGKKAKEFARISFGRLTTADEVKQITHTIVNIALAFSKESLVK